MKIKPNYIKRKLKRTLRYLYSVNKPSLTNIIVINEYFFPLNCRNYLLCGPFTLRQNTLQEAGNKDGVDQ